MQYLKIKNDGVLDIRLVALMGGTTKANDQYKIGQFGTGMKYLFAYCFRNGIDIKLLLGEKEVLFSIEQELIRDEEFNILCIDGARTGITTRMGYDWEAWMICREVWCNALDEGGAAMEVTDQVTGEAGTTTFFIEYSEEIKKVHSNWGKYFIDKSTTIFSNDDIALYPGGNDFRLYKNGVLIHELHLGEGQRSLFSYDVKDASINELRQFTGSVSAVITKAFYSFDRKTAAHVLETISPDYYEGNIDMSWYGTFGDEWVAALNGAKIINKKSLDIMITRGINVDVARFVAVTSNLYSALTKQFEGIGALKVASKIGEFVPHHNEEAAYKVNQAVDILRNAGYPLVDGITYQFGYFEEGRTDARVDFKTKIVYVSNNLADRSLFNVVTMVIEEMEHVRTGMKDESRAFQQHFIDLYAKQLLERGGVVVIS
jgi:hypothetical protein